jgi:hypothetical protein
MKPQSYLALVASVLVLGMPAAPASAQAMSAATAAPATPAAAAAVPAPPGFRLSADVVAAQICIPQSIFAPGDVIVWRAEVQDNNGVRLLGDAIKARGITAVVTLKDGTQIPLRFGIHPPFKNAPKTDTYWTGSLFVKPGHPTGTLPWTLTVMDSTGAKATFTPIGQSVGLSVLTIAKKAAMPKA